VDFWLGLDFGTSGARAIAIDHALAAVAEVGCAYDIAQPASWCEALHELLAALPTEVRRQLRAVAIDGTAATMLLHAPGGQALGVPLRYDDARAEAAAARIAMVAPHGHIAAAATSALAKTLWLVENTADEPAAVLDQATWLAGQLTGRFGTTDYHNALKLGCDPVGLAYPEWMKSLAIDQLLPQVVVPGTPLGTIKSALATRLGLPANAQVVAGTTDSIAAFMAAGVHRPGEAVTSLGSTIALKLLSERRVASADFGVYSHRYGKRWLAGGASNSGGAVLRQFFDHATLVALSARIDPTLPSGLDFYPLPRTGERFPRNDPAMQPRMTPRPADDAQFLQGLLEGMARIEARGYALLVELGATPLAAVFSAGGGAKNVAWQGIRERCLGVPVRPADHVEAAYGAALLARYGSALMDF